MSESDDARGAREEYLAALQCERSVQNSWGRIHSLVTPLRKLREANHFAESIRAAFNPEGGYQ